MCPAAMGKLRCPLRPASMTLNSSGPDPHPAGTAPDCCDQQTITVPPGTHAKTAQKHDYPSAAHRRSYTRRTAAERTFSTAKDPASNNIARGWCRLMGLAPITLFAALIHHPQPAHPGRLDARQAETPAASLPASPPKTRRRRRKTLTSLAAGP